MDRRVLRGLRLALCALVVAVALALAALAWAQHSQDRSWWVELSRYLPYYWLLVPCLAAFAASVWLGRWWTLGSLVAPLLLATAVLDLQWNTGQAGAEQVRVMTFNIKVQTALHRHDGFAALAAEIARNDPDILVMQDADSLLVDRGASALQVAPPIFGLPHVYAEGQYVVASRLPLRGCEPGQMGFRDENHRFLRCRFDVRGVELNVVTAHFKSPRGGLNATRREGVNGVSEWEQNFQDRLTQAHELAIAVARLPRPLVVAGDLNAPEASPVVQALLRVGLRDAFSAAGRGYGFSYGQTMRRGLSFLRIDHILASPDLGVADCFAGGGEASDHRPVVADLILRP